MQVTVSAAGPDPDGAGGGPATARLPSDAQRRAGQPFKIGADPWVEETQCSAAWCVAQALQQGRPQQAAHHWG